MPERSPAGRRLSLLLGAVALVLVGVGVVQLSSSGPSGAGASDAAGPAPAGPDMAAPVARTTSPPAAPAGRWRPGAPRRVVVPALGVDAAVVPVRAPGGTLVPPGDPAELGWWAAGARPGDRRGTTLIAGHTVHTGGGALEDLETLVRGDKIVVRTERGIRRYVVASVKTYSKGAVAQASERLFSQKVPGRLVLVTCEDWDGVRFRSNVVVVAR